MHLFMPPRIKYGTGFEDEKKSCAKSVKLIMPGYLRNYLCNTKGGQKDPLGVDNIYARCLRGRLLTRLLFKILIFIPIKSLIS